MNFHPEIYEQGSNPQSIGSLVDCANILREKL